MIADSVLEIRKIEAQLEDEILKARDQASKEKADLIAEAHETAQKIIEDAKIQAQVALSQSQKRAQEEADQILEEGRQENQKLEDMTDDDLNQAVEFVLERIVI